jgi:hypothetical protein
LEQSNGGSSPPFRTIRLAFQLACGEPKGSLMAGHPMMSNAQSEQFVGRRQAKCESKGHPIMSKGYSNHRFGLNARQR